MHSRWHAPGLLALVAALLLLPVAVSLLGLPPRIEAYKSIPTAAGTAGAVIQSIYQSPPQGDIVFLGSSLLTAGISREAVRNALVEHLHRGVSVQLLAINWPGLDVQYFMLRDYFNAHNARLLVWNLPEPHARAYDYPHVQSYRWLRFGEYADALDGLPLSQRPALYGEMVIGAPRQLLSILRPNLFAGEGATVDPTLAETGYQGTKFVPNEASPGMKSRAKLLPLDAREIVVRGPALGSYQMHFARLIAELAKKKRCRIVLLHIPTDAEFQDASIPELDDWMTQLGPSHKIIAIPSAQLFEGMDRTQFDRFYRDAHLNENGSRYFTQAILPAMLQAYDEAANMSVSEVSAR
ncbi:MAG: hypothetical protein ABR991_06775 [Terracidiphilus sp.]